MTCPQCGQALTVRVPPASDRCPLICRDCARGWWPAELGHGDSWDHVRRGWPPAARRQVLAGAQEDRADLRRLYRQHRSEGRRVPSEQHVRGWLQSRREAHRRGGR